MSRVATLTIVYRGGTDTANRTASISNVDVTAIYDAGYTSGQSVATYPVMFDVTFTDGGSYSSVKQVAVECKDIYNQGAADAQPTTMYAYASNGGLINIRSSASSTAAIAGMVFPRTAVTINGTSGDYYSITCNGTSGYILKTLVTTTANSPSNYQRSGGAYATGLAYYRYVYASNGGAVNVRTSASSSASAIGQLTPKTQFVTANNTSGDFTEIFLYGIDNPGSVSITGSFGWMSSTFISQNATSPSSYSYTGWVYSSSTVVTTVPIGATIYCAEDPEDFQYEWMPCRYGTYTGYMKSEYIRGTEACEYGSFTIAGAPGSNPPATGGYAATVYATSGSTVNLRSSPSS